MKACDVETCEEFVLSASPWCENCTTLIAETSRSSADTGEVLKNLPPAHAASYQRQLTAMIRADYSTDDAFGRSAYEPSEEMILKELGEIQETPTDSRYMYASMIAAYVDRCRVQSQDDLPDWARENLDKLMQQAWGRLPPLERRAKMLAAERYARRKWPHGYT